jgi:hypothetical protein
MFGVLKIQIRATLCHRDPPIPHRITPTPPRHAASLKKDKIAFPQIEGPAHFRF